MHFDTEENRKKIEHIITGFETFCVGAVNVTYERYRFNKCNQEVGEGFDTYLGEIRRLAKNCHFEAVEESMLRDRIVVGLRDDATRRKLLQARNLTLKDAIDMCRASEVAGRQLKAMATPEDVQSLKSTHPSQRRGRRGAGNAGDRFSRRGQSATRRERSAERPCRYYCGRQHAAEKQACPAFGQTCSRCKKLHHFASVCRSAESGPTRPRHVQEMSETDESLHVGTRQCYE